MAGQDEAASEQAIAGAVAAIGRGAGRSGGWLRAGVLAVLAGAVLGAATLWPWGEDSTGPRYLTAAIERRDLVLTVTATGTVFPTEEVEVSSSVSGTVAEVLADPDSVVRAGALLARIDPTRFEAQRDRALAERDVARAQLAEAEATVALMRAVVGRKRTLSETAASSLQDLDTAVAELDRAEAARDRALAEVALAAAALRLAEADLADTAITAPIDGIVLARSVERGQTLAVSLQAPALFRIARDLAVMEVRLEIDEADVGLLAVGQPARFTVDAWPGRSFETTVSELRFASAIVQGVVTYQAILAVANPDLSLRPGMTATAEIEVARHADLPSVPNAALRWRPEATMTADQRSLLERLLPAPPDSGTQLTEPDTGGPVVHVLRDGQPVAVPVTTGPSDGSRTAILAGAPDAGTPVILGTEPAR